MAKEKKSKKKIEEPKTKKKKKSTEYDYIKPEKIVFCYEGTAMELADCLPLIAKAAKLLGKGRTEEYVRKRFGIKKKTLRQWASTTTFIRTFTETRVQAEKARIRMANKKKGKCAFIAVKGSPGLSNQLDKLIRLPKLIAGRKRAKYERYTPEERDAIMFMLALSGSVPETAKAANISERTLEEWKRKLSVSDRENYDMLVNLRRANFLDSISMELEGVVKQYLKQLMKKAVSGDADARTAGKIVSDMILRLRELYTQIELIKPAAASVDEGGIVEAETHEMVLRKLARGISKDEDQARAIRAAIANRIVQDKGITRIGDSLHSE